MQHDTNQHYHSTDTKRKKKKSKEGLKPRHSKYQHAQESRVWSNHSKYKPPSYPYMGGNESGNHSSGSGRFQPLNAYQPTQPNSYFGGYRHSNTGSTYTSTLPSSQPFHAYNTRDVYEANNTDGGRYRSGYNGTQSTPVTRIKKTKKKKIDKRDDNRVQEAKKTHHRDDDMEDNDGFETVVNKKTKKKQLQREQQRQQYQRRKRPPVHTTTRRSNTRVKSNQTFSKHDTNREKISKPVQNVDVVVQFETNQPIDVDRGHSAVTSAPQHNNQFSVLQNKEYPLDKSNIQLPTRSKQQQQQQRHYFGRGNSDGGFIKNNTQNSNNSSSSNKNNRTSSSNKSRETTNSDRVIQNRELKTSLHSSKSRSNTPNTSRNNSNDQRKRRISSTSEHSDGIYCDQNYYTFISLDDNEDGGDDDDDDDHNPNNNNNTIEKTPHDGDENQNDILDIIKHNNNNNNYDNDDDSENTDGLLVWTNRWETNQRLDAMQIARKWIKKHQKNNLTHLIEFDRDAPLKKRKLLHLFLMYPAEKSIIVSGASRQEKITSQDILALYFDEEIYDANLIYGGGGGGGGGNDNDENDKPTQDTSDQKSFIPITTIIFTIQTHENTHYIAELINVMKSAVSLTNRNWGPHFNLIYATLKLPYWKEPYIASLRISEPRGKSLLQWARKRERTSQEWIDCIFQILISFFSLYMGASLCWCDWNPSLLADQHACIAERRNDTVNDYDDGGGSDGIENNTQQQTPQRHLGPVPSDTKLTASLLWSCFGYERSERFLCREYFLSTRNRHSLFTVCSRYLFRLENYEHLVYCSDRSKHRPKVRPRDDSDGIGSSSFPSQSRSPRPQQPQPHNSKDNRSASCRHYSCLQCIERFLKSILILERSKAIRPIPTFLQQWLAIVLSKLEMWYQSDQTDDDHDGGDEHVMMWFIWAFKSVGRNEKFYGPLRTIQQILDRHRSLHTDNTLTGGHKIGSSSLPLPDHVSRDIEDVLYLHKSPLLFYQKKVNSSSEIEQYLEGFYQKHKTSITKLCQQHRQQNAKTSIYSPLSSITNTQHIHSNDEVTPSGIEEYQSYSKHGIGNHFDTDTENVPVETTAAPPPPSSSFYRNDTLSSFLSVDDSSSSSSCYSCVSYKNSDIESIHTGVGDLSGDRHSNIARSTRSGGGRARKRYAQDIIVTPTSSLSFVGSSRLSRSSMSSSSPLLFNHQQSKFKTLRDISAASNQYHSPHNHRPGGGGGGGVGGSSSNTIMHDTRDRSMKSRGINPTTTHQFNRFIPKQGPSKPTIYSIVQPKNNSIRGVKNNRNRAHNTNTGHEKHSTEPTNIQHHNTESRKDTTSKTHSSGTVPDMQAIDTIYLEFLDIFTRRKSKHTAPYSEKSQLVDYSDESIDFDNEDIECNNIPVENLKDQYYYQFRAIVPKPRWYVPIHPFFYVRDITLSKTFTFFQ